MIEKELKYGIRQGFAEITPDIFDDILERIEKEGPLSEGYGYVRNEVRPEKRRTSFRRFQRMAAACVMCVLICVGVFQISGNSTPTYGGEEYTVFMQINPSVRMVFNEEFELLEFKGLNEDGKALEKRLGIEESITLPEVIEKVVEDGQNQGYLNGKNDIHFTFVKKEREQYDQWKNEFTNTVEKALVEKKEPKIATTYEETETAETVENNQGTPQDETKPEAEEKAVENKEDSTSTNGAGDEAKQDQNVLETEGSNTQMQNQNVSDTGESSTDIQGQSPPVTEESNVQTQGQSPPVTEEGNTEVKDPSPPATGAGGTDTQAPSLPAAGAGRTEIQEQSPSVSVESSIDIQSSNAPEIEDEKSENAIRKALKKAEKKTEKALEKEEKKASETNGSQ